MKFARKRVHETQLPIREIGLIAATRGMLGAGVGLLLAERLPEQRRKKVGWALFLVGAASTIPLVRDVRARTRRFREEWTPAAPA